MEAHQIEVLAVKFGKIITLGYHDKVDDRNKGIDEEEAPHPDLKKALVALHPYLASAFYVLGEERENFIPTGFSITKAGGEETIDQVEISGKISTSHGKKIGVKSGDIPINVKGFENIIENIQAEVWAFFFNGKTAVTQGNLPGFQSKKDAAKEVSTPEEEPPI